MLADFADAERFCSQPRKRIVNRSHKRAIGLPQLDL
jgi:hypothetical protein